MSEWDGLIIPEFFINRHVGTQRYGDCVKLYFGLVAADQRLIVPSFAAIWQLRDLAQETARVIDAIAPAPPIMGRVNGRLMS